jgi:hypothetical protein
MQTPPSSYDPRTFDVYTQAARAALLFSFPGPRGLPEGPDAFASVTTALRENFFATSSRSLKPIYVDRTESQSVESALRSRRGVILLGERGTGKSTVLYASLLGLGALNLEWLSRYGLSANDIDIVVDDSRWHVHFNCNHLTASDLAAVGGANEYMFRRVYHRLLDNQDASLAKRWKLWRLRESDIYAEARNAMLADGLTPDALNTDISLKGLVSAADESFVALSYDLKFRELIQFMQSDGTIEITICIDNADHLASEHQKALVDSMVALRRASTTAFGFAIALRPESWRRIDTGQFRGDATVSCIELASLPSDENLRVVTEVITRRLERITSDPIRAELVAAVAALEVSDDPGKLAEEVLDATLGFIRYFLEDSEANRDERIRTAEIRTLFHEWYNNSIRLVSLGLVGFVTELLQDVNPVFPLRLWSSRAQNFTWSQMRPKELVQIESLARTAVYHHLITHTQAHLQPGIKLADSNIMILTSRRTRVERDDAPFLYLKLRVLQRLLKIEAEAGQRGKQVNVGRLVRHFRDRFGVAQHEVFLGLAELTYPRFPDDLGLLRIDRLAAVDLTGTKPQAVANDISNHDHVELLPAGRLLASRLVYTCEFLFLSLAHSGHYSLLGRMGGDAAMPTRRDFRNTHQRVFAAATFVQKVLLPTFLQEHPGLIGSDSRVVIQDTYQADRLRHYSTSFGVGPGDWLLSRMVGGIRRHAGERYESDEYFEVRTTLEEVDGFIQRLDLASDAWRERM